MAAKRISARELLNRKKKWDEYIARETKKAERKLEEIARKKKKWDKYVESETQRLLAAKRKPLLEHLGRFLNSDVSEHGIFRMGTPFKVPVFEVLYKVKEINPKGLAKDICDFVQKGSRVPFKVSGTYGPEFLFLVKLDRGVGIKGKVGFSEVNTFDFSQTSEALDFIESARKRNVIPVVCFAKLL